MTTDEIMALVYKYGSICWSHGTEGEQEIAENNVSAAVEEVIRERGILRIDHTAQCQRATEAEERAERAERDYEELGVSIQSLQHPNCQLLLNDKRKAERERDELRALLIEARGWLVYTTPLQERQKLLARIDAKVKP